MSFIKKYYKFFVLLIVVILITFGFTVYATYNYFADGIGYTRAGTSVANVEQALNDLYSRTNNTSNVSLTTCINFLNNGLSVRLSSYINK